MDFLKRFNIDDAATQLIFMLIILVALVHGFILVDLSLRLDDRLATDWACVVVVGPAEEALDMKNMVNVTFERNDRVTVIEIYKTDGTLSAEGVNWLLVLFILLLLLQFFLLGTFGLAVAHLAFEEDSAHASGVRSQVDRLASQLLHDVGFSSSVCVFSLNFIVSVVSVNRQDRISLRHITQLGFDLVANLIHSMASTSK